MDEVATAYIEVNGERYVNVKLLQWYCLTDLKIEQNVEYQSFQSYSSGPGHMLGIFPAYKSLYFSGVVLNNPNMEVWTELDQDYKSSVLGKDKVYWYLVPDLRWR